MRYFRFLLLCVFVVLSAACSRSSWRAPSLTEESPVVSNLVLGTYSTGCQASGPTFAQFDVVVTATTLEFSSTFYYDSACAQPRVKFSHEDTYVEVGASATPAGARDINVTNGKIFYTLLSAAAVTASNNISECGFSNWSLNVAKDVSGTVCQDIPLNSLTYTVARTANDQFEIGMADPSDLTPGSTDNLRITNFIPIIFNKQ